MTRSEFETTVYRARIDCNWIDQLSFVFYRAFSLACLILTFVLFTGCATNSQRESSFHPGKTKKMALKRGPVTNMKPAEVTIEPAPDVATPMIPATANPEATDISAWEKTRPVEVLSQVAPAETGSPPNRATAAFDPKGSGRFRTLSPEVPAFSTGIKAADEIVTIAASPSGKSKKEKLNEAHLIFDFPVTYNARVRKWIRYFQTTGRSSFRRWLERSTRYIPYIHTELKRAGLPTDIAYVAMIESGFSSSAVSHANAMGMWQFIAPTGERYGLKVEWWIDERRDYEKATKAAIGYMSDLFEQFGSWYLVAASYNMGEGGVRRLINRHKTNSFWDLADRGALPEETRNYVPKMLAAMLIAKAPALYGFRDLEFHVPFAFEYYKAPGGTDLINLANHLGVSERSLTELNPELLKGFIPRDVKSHRIRIPKGSRSAVAMYLNQSETATQ
jgi:membrane-bound lytic murein transglycosylase D